MEWKQFQDKFGVLQTHAQISDCGQYKISKAYVLGQWHYLTWKHNGKHYELTGESYYTSFEEARESIERTDKVA